MNVLTKKGCTRRRNEARQRIDPTMLLSFFRPGSVACRSAESFCGLFRWHETA